MREKSVVLSQVEFISATILIESVFYTIQKSARRLPLENRYPIRPPFDMGQFHCAGAVLSRIEPQISHDLTYILKISRGFSGSTAF